MLARFFRWRADRAYAAFRAYQARPAMSGWDVRVALALETRANALVARYVATIR